MTRKLVVALLLLALAGAVVGGIMWAYETWRSSLLAEGDARGAARVQAQWNLDTIGRAEDHRQAVAEARREERRMAEQAARGERDAREKAEHQAKADRDAAAAAGAAARGLSGDIAALNQRAAALGLPGAAACPAEFVRQRDEAVRARNLLAACSTRYTELAAAVDDAWTGLTLRLDTAIGYIRAVAPPVVSP